MAKLGDLGELGARAVRKDIHFGWFGEQMRIHPTATELVLVDFQERAAAVQLPDGVDFADPESIAALTDEEQLELQATMLKALPMVKDYLRQCVHPEDFDAFWRAGLENGYNSERFMGVATVLVDRAAQVSAGRPTQPSRSSGPMRRRTKGKSGGGSSSRATGWMDPAAARVIKRHERNGRPDLAEIVTMRQEYLAASV